MSFAGAQLYHDLVAAVEQRDKQREFFREFDATIPVEVSREWEELVRDFEEDPLGQNPYEETETGKAVLKAVVTCRILMVVVPLKRSRSRMYS